MTENLSDATSPTKPVVIAVLTYRRPQDIALALPRLAVQAAALAAGGRDPVSASVLVIDNDPGSSARSIVDELASQFPPGLVTYVHEPSPGIAAARNRALTEAPREALLGVYRRRRGPL